MATTRRGCVEATLPSFPRVRGGVAHALQSSLALTREFPCRGLIALLLGRSSEAPRLERRYRLRDIGRQALAPRVHLYRWTRRADGSACWAITVAGVFRTVTIENMIPDSYSPKDDPGQLPSKECFGQLHSKG